ncbi:EAL domain-containing protein [Pseudomonas sp. SK2]|uniref:EAL domain-containing protein n=1 Tax=Pseudomonas sp. SK2 TaxID=2841063 RepID=UPI00192C0DDA|nr:EAL domain-containing protein [Pseudomonas sp. SK2]QQZ35130.1 EAL domain-containing protein [Pseudomonas sp. SK2]
MRFNIIAPSSLAALRVVILAASRVSAQPISNMLKAVQVKPLASFATLDEIEVYLSKGSVDIIICRICPACDAGLLLLSVLNRMHKSGNLERLPSLFWMGETSMIALARPGDNCAFGLSAIGGAAFIKCMGGVAITALESLARLAKVAGIHVKILPQCEVLALNDALRAALMTNAKDDIEPAQATFDSLVEDEMINALTTGEGLRFVFQPQFDLLSRRVVGAEALVRWKHPRFGDIPPSVMIPLVNRLGLDLLLFSLVEMWAIRLLVKLKRENHQIPVAVNASAKTLCTPQFAERLAARMHAVGLPTPLLKLELTEDVPEPDDLLLSAALTTIRAKGFQISLDDFGVGAATMNLLVNTLFDEVKIDGSLVRSLGEHSSSGKVISGLVNWARLLMSNVVAEGIEDESIIPFLRQLGCQVGQGYALAHPMEFNDFMMFMKK